MLDRACDRGRVPVAQEAVLQVSGWCVSPNEVVEAVSMVGLSDLDRAEAQILMTARRASAIAAPVDQGELRVGVGVS